LRKNLPYDPLTSFLLEHRREPEPVRGLFRRAIIRYRSSSSTPKKIRARWRSVPPASAPPRIWSPNRSRLSPASRCIKVN